MFDRQPDGVTDGSGRLLDHADFELSNQFGDGGTIEGHRSLDIGVGSEQDQPQTIALAALREIANHDLHYLEA